MQSLSSYIGVDGDNATLNSGRLLINLKPHGQRDLSAAEVITRLQPQIDKLVGIRLYMQPVQDLTIEDRVSRTSTSSACRRQTPICWRCGVTSWCMP